MSERVVLVATDDPRCRIVEGLLVSSLPESMQSLDPARLGLALNDIKNLAVGNIVSSKTTPELQAAADEKISD